MLKSELEEQILTYFATSSLNAISPEQALHPSCIGAKIFNAPLVAYGDAEDALFVHLQDSVIGGHFKLPAQWCADARTVISIFAPLTQKIIASNALSIDYPSPLWLHGRYEGQNFLAGMARDVVGFLQSKGYTAICPVLSEDFMSVQEGQDLSFTSNWSERHVAFVCGIGTFGLSKGIISEKGMAGRLISLVTTADLPKTARAYTDIYEYCTQCGACIPRCPVHAISQEKGKEHIPCSRFIDIVLEKERPRYACGKCQTKVPCSVGIPKRRTS